MRAVAIAALFFVACASSPPDAQPVRAGAVPPTASRGLSCDSAVVIEAANTKEGISRENAWIRENYPGAIKEGQSLLRCNDKPADAIHIVTANGQKMTVFFDISGWFGK
jgi:hypothetical protein